MIFFFTNRSTHTHFWHHNCIRWKIYAHDKYTAHFEEIIDNGAAEIKLKIRLTSDFFGKRIFFEQHGELKTAPSHF